MKKFKIYALSSSQEPENYRYIGQTVKSLNDRLIMHRYKAKVENNHRANWIKKEIQNGNQILITELDEVEEDKWVEAERHYIRLFKSMGANLTNYSDGGESNMLGKKHSRETIEKMIKTRTGRPGITHSEETKEKLRQKTLQQIKEKGHPRGMLGKKQSKESIEKMLETKRRNKLINQ